MPPDAVVEKVAVWPESTAVLDGLVVETKEEVDSTVPVAACVSLTVPI